MKLTDTQEKIITELSTGKQDKEIAKAIGLSFSGYRYHINRLFDIFGVHDRTQLILLLLRKGIITVKS